MSASRPMEIDESHWPLLIIRYMGTLSTAQFKEILAARSRYLDRGERHVLVHDLTHSGNVSSGEQRRLQMEWMKEEYSRLRELVVGIAYVTDSVPLRLLLSTVHYIRPLPMPHVIVPRLSAALPWSVTQLRQAGLLTETHPLVEHLEDT